MKTSTYLKASLSLTAWALVSAFNAGAQITLTSSDMPQIGKVYVYVNDTVPTVTPGSAGTSQTWTLTAIKNDYIDTLYAVSPSSTPYHSSFPSANLALRTDVKGFGEAYEYANLGTDSLLVVGTIASANGDVYYGSIKPANIGLVLPAMYNIKWSGSYLNVTKASTGNGDSVKEVVLMGYTDIIDGWGTVQTPAGSFNSLRVNAIFQTQYDSVFFYSFGMWISAGTVPNTKSQAYSWYANGMGSYVAQLETDGNGTVTSASYLKNAPTGLSEVKDYSSALVYPNPASSFVNVVVKTANQTGYVRILDITGREMETDALNNSKTQINTSAYANGVYLYLVTDMTGNLLDEGRFTVAH